LPLVLWSLRFSQFSPRSVERKNPPDLPAASMIAYTVSGSTGETARPARPMSSSGRPFVSFRQLAPPSVVLYRADSGPPPIIVHTCRRLWCAAAMRTSGSRGSMTTSATPVFSLIVRTAFQVLPPSVVL
jgi:hypothetical protein